MHGFGSTRTLRNLNVAAVGLSLAACTAMTFDTTLRISGLATGPSTLLAGICWALCLRSRKTVGRSRLRKGWALSVPIAIANAAVACGLHMILYDEGSFLVGMLAGATIGVFVWLPALACTLCCFGAPIAWSQHAAERGLAGEERGEAVVGLACLVFSALALALWFGSRNASSMSFPDEAWITARVHRRGHGVMFAVASAVLGVLFSATATVLALVRESRRRRFVRSVSAGAVPGFRVDDTAEGRVLVRVTEMGQGYRVANFTEELFLLDEAGQATCAPTQRVVAANLTE